MGENLPTPERPTLREKGSPLGSEGRRLADHLLKLCPKDRVKLSLSPKEEGSL